MGISRDTGPRKLPVSHKKRDFAMAGGNRMNRHRFKIPTGIQPYGTSVIRLIMG